MTPIYIATYFDWSSYGAILQALSLNQYLNKIGFDAYLINYKQEDLNFHIKSNWKQKLLGLRYALSRHRLMISANRFIERNIKLTDKINKYNELSKFDSKDSYFISGSDQVWHPALCSPFFFLDFVKEGHKVSYAASMGVLEIEKSTKEKFGYYLKDFEKISCREESVKNVIQNLVHNKEINVHIDPVFLNNVEYWSSLEENYPIKGPYILVYPIYWEYGFNSILKEIYQKNGIQIVVLGEAPKTYSTKKILDATPGQFLYLFHHAEQVITSSFHGVAFSMIYKKDFQAIVNPKSSSRISDLLKRFHLSENYCQYKYIIKSTDYTNFDEILNNEINKSYLYFYNYLPKI